MLSIDSSVCLSLSRTSRNVRMSFCEIDESCVLLGATTWALLSEVAEGCGFSTVGGELMYQEDSE